MIEGQRIVFLFLIYILLLPPTQPLQEKTSEPCPLPTTLSGCQCTKTQAQIFLHCEHQNLASIPSNISDLTDLKVIFDNITIISDIPYPKLETLHLEMNHIRFVMDHAFKSLGKLITLNLADNNISGIQKATFEGLTSVEILILSGNPLFTILAEVFTGDTLPALQILKLERCSIFSIEENSFAGLVQLTTLTIAANRLESLPMFGDDRTLPILNFLNISKNHLHLMSATSFVHLRALIDLYLDDNLLTSIKNGSFNSVKDSLKLLSLRNNTLREIGEDSLYCLSKLDTLDLSFNSLQKLNSNTLPWDVLAKPLIHDNPWDCGDCLNSWLVEEEAVKMWNSESNVTCASPADQFGRSVYSKDSTAFSKCNTAANTFPSTIHVVSVLVIVGIVIASVMIIACIMALRRRDASIYKQKVNGESMSLAYSKMPTEPRFSIDDEREEL